MGILHEIDCFFICCGNVIDDLPVVVLEREMHHRKTLKEMQSEYLSLFFIDLVQSFNSHSYHQFSHNDPTGIPLFLKL